MQEKKTDQPRAVAGTDLIIASALGLAAVVLVMSTTWMGITRDESFYIHYGKVYTNWFTELYRTKDSESRKELLSREGVKKVWKNNSEHPPLMKVLFGASWRFLGHKKRTAMVNEDGSVRITGLGLSHGFEEGDAVQLMVPSLLGEDPDGLVRVVGTIEIVSRSRQKAEGILLDATTDPGELAELCRVAKANDPVTYQTSCMARSDDTLQFLSESDAFRFPGALSFGLLVAFVYLFGVLLAGRLPALLAMLMFTFIPRTFFHAHLTCFDIPITALNLVVLYAFYRSLHSTRWAVASGVLWGLALLAKLNAFFIPITLVIWWVAAHATEFRRVGGWRFSLPRFPKAFLFMPAIGLPMLFIFWPWLWYDSVAAFSQYVSFHMTHEHYFQYYLGRAYQSPPFPMDFPFVMTLVTVPVVTLTAFLVGSVITVSALFRGKIPGRGSDYWFVCINMAFPICLIALPGTPIFGGVKHWLLSMPFVCIVGGIGVTWMFARAWEGLVAIGVPRYRAYMRGAGVAAVVVLLAPAVRDTIVYCPYGTAYYNELIGGLRGAARHRMQRQFWSYASRGCLDYVNATAPPQARIDFQDATSGTCGMLKLEGWLRSDLKCVTRTHSPEIMLFDVEERFTEEEMRYWDRMDTLGPVFEVAADGVPMVRVYRKRAGLQQMEEDDHQ